MEYCAQTFTIYNSEVTFRALSQAISFIFLPAQFETADHYLTKLSDLVKMCFTNRDIKIKNKDSSFLAEKKF
jgi:hypothetical protein